MKPEYIGLLTLMVEPGTPLEQWVREGSFRVLGGGDSAGDDLLLDHIDSEGSVFRMNHASNYLTLKGNPEPGPARPAAAGAGGLMGHGLRPESWRPVKNKQTPLYPAGYRGRGAACQKGQRPFLTKVCSLPRA